MSQPFQPFGGRRWSSPYPPAPEWRQMPQQHAAFDASAREPAHLARRRRRHLWRQRRGQDHLRQSGRRAHAGLDRPTIWCGNDMHSMVHHTHPDGSHYHQHDCPIYAAFRDGADASPSSTRSVLAQGTFDSGSNTHRRRFATTAALIGAVIVFRDVTQRREADEKLRAAHHGGRPGCASGSNLRTLICKKQIKIDGNHHGIIGRERRDAADTCGRSNWSRRPTRSVLITRREPAPARSWSRARSTTASARTTGR